jgi:hypothetical protein
MMKFKTSGMVENRHITLMRPPHVKGTNNTLDEACSSFDQHARRSKRFMP